MLIACFALAALACSAAFAETPPNEQGQQESSVTEAQTEQNEAQTQVQNQVPLHRHPTLLSMLKRSNEIRRRLGLAPHRINPALTKAAQDHADYMARTGDFQHYSNGGPQNRAFKYGFHGFVRENIAYNYRTVEDAFSVWQGSGAHYASIVSGTSEAGFGYAVGVNGAVYYVGVYGNGTAADEVGEVEGLAEKLAAEEKEKEGAADPAPAKVEVDRQVVPAAAQEPIQGEPPQADASPNEPQVQGTAAQPQTQWSSNKGGRRLFRWRR